MYRNNKCLHEQVEQLTLNFENKIDELEQEKEDMNIKLVGIINLVNNNDMVEDIIMLMDNPDKCKQHNEVYKHMREYQDNMEKQLNNLIR
jgi:hypothetical protein